MSDPLTKTDAIEELNCFYFVFFFLSRFGSVSFLHAFLLSPRNCEMFLSWRSFGVFYRLTIRQFNVNSSLESLHFPSIAFVSLFPCIYLAGVGSCACIKYSLLFCFIVCPANSFRFSIYIQYAQIDGKNVQFISSFFFLSSLLRFLRTNM